MGWQRAVGWARGVIMFGCVAFVSIIAIADGLLLLPSRAKSGSKRFSLFHLRQPSPLQVNCCALIPISPPFCSRSVVVVVMVLMMGASLDIEY